MKKERVDFSKLRNDEHFHCQIYLIMKQFLRLSLLLSFIFLINQTVFSQSYKQTQISINNIKALISNIGNHFRDIDDFSAYIVPKNGNASTIYANSLWVGGKDISGDLKLAAVCYRELGNDYWPGPLSIGTATIDVTTMNAWNRFFTVTKQDLLDFSNNPSDIPASILEWPAHGDTTKGQAFYLAPFHDVDGDSVYNPYKGDYPAIKGDEAVFFIFNDNFGSHTESEGSPIGMEVHAMVYAFDSPGDEALNNTLFMNYKLFNRSLSTLHDTYVGLWTDFDIGYAYDDYIGCDVERGTYYGYNGELFDGTGLDSHYGNNSPLQTLTILGGPYLDPDGYDNPSYKGDNIGGPSFARNYDNICEIVTQHENAIPFTWHSNEVDATITENVLVRSEAINGMNFGDGIIDNERLGMSKFLYHNDVGGNPATTIAADYYNFMRGIWKDNSRVRYGATGHHPGDITNLECDFMFPGTSDPCNWGTKGVNPNYLWTEEAEANAPNDRRGLASMGPFTFEAGSMHELDFAFITVFAKDTLPSLERYGEAVDSIRTAFLRGTTSLGQDFNTIVDIYVNIKDYQLNSMLKIYPNPVQNTLYIQSFSTIEQVSIYDISGRILQQLPSSSQSIDVSGLAKGIYLVKVKTESGETIRKIVKE